MSYQAIENYGVIGDLHTALVGMDGSIDFMCAPRFDSASVFAALLARFSPTSRRSSSSRWRRAGSRRPALPGCARPWVPDEIRVHTTRPLGPSEEKT